MKKSLPPAPNLNGRGKATNGYCSIAAGDGPGGPRRPFRHVAISQSRRHPKRSGQSLLVQK